MGPKKRTLVLINTNIFCILSFMYNLVIYSLGKGQSVLSMMNNSIIYEYSTILVMALMTMFSIYRVKKFSLVIYGAFISTILFLTLNIFLDSFDKVILGLNFIFAIISYYFYLLLKSELDEPYYNPGYYEGQLSSYNNKDLKVVVSNEEGEITGELTNWGENGFFCQVGEKRPSGRVSFSIDFRGKKFSGSGVVVYHSATGLGVVSDHKKQGNLGWSHFYGIMKEFGIRPKVHML